MSPAPAPVPEMAPLLDSLLPCMEAGVEERVEEEATGRGEERESGWKAMVWGGWDAV
jgi:hypothetical protein